MPTWLISILTIFAGPIGNLVTKGLTAAGAAITAWAVSKGASLDSMHAIVGEFIAAISTVIGMLASSQGVTIPTINAAANGVKVVSATSTSPAVDGPQNGG